MLVDIDAQTPGLLRTSRVVRLAAEAMPKAVVTVLGTYQGDISNAVLDHETASVNLGSDFDSLYGAAEPTSSYVNSNISPNFAYAAKIWASMWQKFSGETVNGLSRSIQQRSAICWR